MTTSTLSEHFIEVIDRSGTVRERIPVGDEAIILGRSYDCQVIIDDPYVCPHHVKISLDNNDRLLVEDMESVNGLSENRHGPSKKQLHLTPGDECFIGWTKLRFHSRNEKVAPARIDHSRQLIFSVLQRPLFLAAIIILPFIQLTFTAWLEQAREVEFHTLLITPASVYLFLIAWAFIWAMAGKLLVHRALFFTHLAIATLMVSISTLVEGATNYGVFMSGSDDALLYIQHITSFILIAAMLYAHLHFASRGKPKSQLISSLFFSAAIMMISAYFVFEGDKQFSSSPRYTATLKPPAFIIGRTRTADEFFEGMDNIKQDIDSLRKQDN